MARIRTLVTAAVAAFLAAGAATAQQPSDQLYLVAFEAPLGSISSAGQGETALYVRWDPLEGALPSDLTTFELFRDGVSVGVFPATGTVDDAALGALYAGPENERRRFELVRWLAEEDPEQPVSPANFEAVLRERVLDVPARAAFASRVDVNVARALHRAHLDAGLANGSYEYELRGHFAGGQDVRLGRTTAVKDGVPDAAPAAAGFEQVSMRRCDAPEGGKDHHVVALNWRHAGDTMADRFAHGIGIAGYDLFRSVAATAVVAPRNLRSEAAAAPHDGLGRVSLAGLEQVNDQPLVIAGAAERETRYDGFNPDFTQFFETSEELLAHGLEPGDRRAYYLVARDLSGNWGETTGILVTIPDFASPVPPWQVRGYPRDIDALYTLTWPHVDVRNYFERHRVGRTYCNVETARLDRYLAYVPDEAACEDRRPIRADLAVVDYLVFRFRDSGRAARFVDRDGDGFHDPEERPDVTDPGTACDPNAPDPAVSALDNHLVAVLPASSATAAPSGHQQVSFPDAEPGLNVGTTFWYRVATRDAAGNVSQLSEPVPALVSDTTRPQRDEALGDVWFGRRICENVITGGPSAGPFTAHDNSENGSAQTLRITCEPDDAEATPVVRVPFVEFEDGTRRAVLDAEQCSLLADPLAGCGGKNTSVEYLDQRGRPLIGGTLPLPGGFLCATQVLLVDLCPIGIDYEIADGEVVPESEGPVLEPGAGPNCTNVYRLIDGRRSLLSTLCPGDDPLALDDLPDLGGEAICLAVASYDENAQNSMMERLPCFRRPGLPSPPTPVAIAFTPGSDQVQLSFLQAELPAEGAMLEWSRLGDPTTRATRFVPRPPGPDLNAPQTFEVTITPEPAGAEWQEQWCFRGLSVGGLLAGDGASGVSAWSVEACGIRQPVAAEAPPALGWPQIPAPPEGAPIQARLLATDQLPVLLLSDAITGGTCPISLPECAAGDACVGEAGQPVHPVLSTNCSPCDSIVGALDESPPFAVYRQWRAGPLADPSDFAQVSPLVEPFCHAGLPSSLSDPFVSVVRFPAGDAWGGHRLVYVDRTPYREDIEVRYQVVYFTPAGEIRSSRTSSWIGL